MKDNNIKSLLEKPEIIDAFTIYLMGHFADSMAIPDVVKYSKQDMKQDDPITLETIV